MKDAKQQQSAPKNRVNWLIKASSVRVVRDGQQIGVMPLKDAIDYAVAAELDLVEIASNGNIPVCSVLDYGKFKYDQGVKEKKQKKNRTTTEVKELQFKPNIDKHDIEIKINKLREFLTSGKVVVLRMEFKARQNAHKDRGLAVIQEIISMVQDISEVVQLPRSEGNKIIVKLSPKAV